MDMLAVICFIGVILFGWLPGPGGLPLFLAGLGLLSINHDWAKRWLDKLKSKTTNFRQVLFPDNKHIKLIYDLLAFILLGLGLWLIERQVNRVVNALSLGVFGLALTVFLVNRDRIDRLRRSKHKK